MRNCQEITQLMWLNARGEKMNFGEKVSQLRKQKKITQRELADEIGVSLRTITNYETGGRYPKQREIYRKIADALEVDVNYLLTENETFIVYAREEYGSKGMQQAQRLLAEVRGLFSGGTLDEDDKDEMMRAIQDAYWVAKEKNSRKSRIFDQGEE